MGVRLPPSALNVLPDQHPVDADNGTTADAGPRFGSRPPRWLFHGVTAVLAIGLLSTFSLPGSDFLAGYMWSTALIVAAIVWGFRAYLVVVRRRPNETIRNARWFLVAPLGGVIVYLLIVGSVPLRLRWAASEPAFERLVASVDSSTTPPLRGEATRIGWYDITNIVVVDDGILFYEDHGAFLDDAGFAYLPHGPYPGLENGGFENPRFVHLHGPWYAWTASW